MEGFTVMLPELVLGVVFILSTILVFGGIALLAGAVFVSLALKLVTAQV